MPTAIVTGGAVRFGKAFACHLAQKGYSIALHYHASAADAEGVIDAVRRRGVRCEPFPCDFRDLRAAEQLMPRITGVFSDVTLLVNSAANFIQENIAATRTQTLLDSFHVNLFTPFLLMREYRRLVNRGMIVNILDERILRNVPTFAAYSAAKVGLAHLTHLAAIEWGAEVRVNGIAPGLILPPAGQTEEYLKRETKHVPVNNHGSPADILRGLDYLLDSPFVNGEVLFIDGGESKNPGYTFPRGS